MLKRYLAVGTLARAGDEASGPAILLAATALGQPTARAALVVAALTGSTVVGGPVVGALIDRSQRPRLAYALGLGTAAAGLAAIAIGLDDWPLPAVAAAGLTAGLAQPVFSGGWTARLAGLVPADRRDRAYALDVASYDVAGIAGPALAAAALALGARAPVSVAALLFLGALVALGPMAGRPAVATTRIVADVVTGLRTVLGRPALREVTFVSSLQHAGLAARTIAAPGLAERATGHVAFAGLLLAVAAAASLAGSLLLTRVRPPGGPMATVYTATAVTAVGLAGLAITTSPWAELAIFAVGGLADAPLLTAVFVIRAAHAPAEQAARVFTIGAAIKVAAYAVGVAGFGLLTGAGSTTVLLAGAAVQAAGLLLGPLSGHFSREWSRIRDHSREK